jgi:hypothetical protein
MTVGPGITPDLLTLHNEIQVQISPSMQALAGLFRHKKRCAKFYRRWGITPRPEDVQPAEKFGTSIIRKKARCFFEGAFYLASRQSAFPHLHSAFISVRLCNNDAAMQHGANEVRIKYCSKQGNTLHSTLVLNSNCYAVTKTSADHVLRFI